jgi:ankyrin repeat protein
MFGHAERKDDIIEKYAQQSLDPENVGYSPFQCALYEGKLAEINHLLRYYKAKGSLSDELSHTSAGVTRENVLHVAMKHTEAFQLCCTEINNIGGLLETLLQQHDADGDTVLHQMVEFGRLEALNVLREHAEPSILHASLTIPNAKGETAETMAKDYIASTTVADLIESRILSEDNLKTAQLHAPSIAAAFEEIQVSRTMKP